MAVHEFHYGYYMAGLCNYIIEKVCMSDINSKRMSYINTNLPVRNIDINPSMLDIKTCIFPSKKIYLLLAFMFRTKFYVVCM